MKLLMIAIVMTLVLTTGIQGNNGYTSIFLDDSQENEESLSPVPNWVLQYVYSTVKEYQPVSLAPEL